MSGGVPTVQVADELAIRNVLTGSAFLADVGDLAELHEFFSPDAAWVTTRGTHEGLAAVTTAYQGARDAGFAGPASRNRHLVSTVAIRLGPGDGRATARSYWTLVGPVDGSLVLKMTGEYEDQLVRRDGGWRIVRRVVSTDRYTD
jgi:SnoaL-like domain